MAFSRRLGVVCILGASWLAAVACSDDSDKVKVVGDAGAGGEAPSGGKSSAGGSSNNAGAPTAGDAGKGGISTGGNAGTTNMAGNPGSGAGPESQAGAAGTPAVAPNGGAGGAPDMVGGAGGAAAGAGGAAGAPAAVAQKCSFSCANDNDCVIGVDDTSHKCNLTTHLCEDPASVCATNDDCLPTPSAWIEGCTGDDCFDGYTCVSFNGNNFCAPVPDPTFGCDPYTTMNMPAVGQAGNVDVCGDDTWRCGEDATCFPGCTGFGCPAGGGDTCNATTGLCECQSGDECDTGVCGGDSRCTVCKVDDDCAANSASTGLDICVNGKCGCSAPAACVNSYATATSVCE